MRIYGTLVCCALDQLWVQGEADGCCPICCASCAALKELKENKLLDALVQQAPTHLWLNSAWWVGLMVDPEWLTAAWRMTSCHEPMSGRPDPEPIDVDPSWAHLAAIDEFLDDPTRGRVRSRYQENQSPAFPQREGAE